VYFAEPPTDCQYVYNLITLRQIPFMGRVILLQNVWMCFSTRKIISQNVWCPALQNSPLPVCTESAKKMYTHFNVYHLLNTYIFLQNLYILNCISNEGLLGNEFIYDKTNLFRVISVYGTAEVFWICHYCCEVMRLKFVAPWCMM
jgi:hypothetical protein